MNRSRFWDTATEADNLREQWICDKSVTNQQCREAIGELKGRTLDLGCGIGRLTTDFGIDLSPKMLALAKHRRPNKKFKLCDGWMIPYKDNYFDSVFSLFMFQHIPDDNKDSYMIEVYRVLKPGGKFRLQYVEYGEAGPFSYPIENLELGDFKLIEKDKGLIMKEWTWLTLVK